MSLAAAFGAPLVSKDAIKERLALEPATDASYWLGMVAAEHMWTEVSAKRGLVIVDCWWFTPRDLRFAITGLYRSGAARAVELVSRSHRHSQRSPSTASA